MDANPDTLASKADTPVLTGTIAKRFVILECLGSGGMGEVYRADDKKLKRTVAIKRISSKYRANPVYRSRLVKEAWHASGLNDPHVATVYDIITEGDESFLVMEFVEGKSLRECVDGKVGHEDFQSIAKQCLQGLAAAHRRHIVHRDIKPENVLITADRQVKICDFGLARMTLTDGAEAATVTEGVMGTPGYMAPEAHLGSKSDPRSDVFSLGMTLFELWAGHHPFTEGSFRRMRASSYVPPSPGSVRPGLDSRLDAVIQRMLAFSPADRYADAGQALLDLDVTEALPVPSRSTRRRYALGFAAVAVLLLAVLGGSRYFAPEKLPEHSPPSVLLADIENNSGDSYYDLTVSQLLALAMEQSQYLNVMSQYRVSEALARAKASPGTVVTLPVALDLARREGATFVLWGEVSGNPEQLTLTLRASDTRSGKQQQAFPANFKERSTLASQVQNLSTQMRAWLGEPMSRITGTNVSLAQATTQSAIAWERFSRAVQADSLGRMSEAVSLLKSAIEVDPDFAIAHEKLSAMQSRAGNLRDSLASMQRAYDLRDSVTEREKYTIISRYHAFRWEWDLALDASQRLTALYPYDDVGRRYYAQALTAVLQKPEAIAEAQNAVALNPYGSFNWGTLLISLSLANRNDEVLSIGQALRKIGIQTQEPSEANALLAKGDFHAAQGLFAQMAQLPGSQGNYGRLGHAKALIYEGRLEEGAASLEADLKEDLPLRDERLAIQRRDWVAWIRALQGDRQAATDLAGIILQSPVSPTNVYQLRELGCMLSDIGEVGLARRVLAQLQKLVASDFRDRFFNGAVLHLKGEVARAQGQRESARAYLNEAAAQWVDVLTLWSLARVSEDLGDFQYAHRFYLGILDRQGEIVRVHFPGLAALARAGVIRSELRLGDREQARLHFQEFSNTLGKNSPDLKLVRALRQQFPTTNN